MARPPACWMTPRCALPISANDFLRLTSGAAVVAARTNRPAVFSWIKPGGRRIGHNGVLPPRRLFAMNRSFSFVALALTLGLSASALQAEEMSVGDLPASRPADTTPRLAYGQVIKYGDRIMFAPCRDRSFIQIEDVSEGLQVLQALNAVGLSAGRKLYVEAYGYVEGVSLRLSRVNLAHAEGRCQVPGSDGETWRASGNEPGWVLAVGGEWIQLKRLGEPEVAFKTVPARQAAGVTEIVAEQDGHALNVRFEAGQCRDTMADAVFGWSATVTLDGKTLRGCAWER